MADQALDAALERDRRARASGARALHGEEQGAVLVAAIDDIAAVLGDRRAHPGLDEIAELVDDLGIGGIVLETGVRSDLDPGRRAGSARLGRTTGHGLAGNIARHYPRWLALTLVGLLLAANTATFFGLNDQLSTWSLLATLPVAAWELSLGVWMVVKGFRASPVTADTV